MNRLIVIVALLSLTLSSCGPSRIYFTVDTKLRLDKAGIGLQKVQFYPSADIVLVRQISTEEVDVVKGKVKIEGGRKVEEIIIPAGTPGICEFNDERSMRVSFDQGDGKLLVFQVERRDGNVVPGSYFKIAAKEWITLNSGGRVGTIDYNGKVFTMVRGQDTRLMIDKSVISKTERNTSVAKGRKVN